MYFNICASGSKGNATLVGNDDTLILIDMGVSLTTLKDGLNEINKDIKDIKGVFFTHEHTDHVKGKKFLSNCHKFALEGTFEEDYLPLKKFQSVYIGSFKITPLRTSHDANNPCGYCIEDGKEKLVYITDTGFVPEESINFSYNPTYLIIESNHDLTMLVASSRPYILKNRIMSDVGHMCNEDSAIYATSIVGNKTKEIVLAHLSEECNTEERALKAYKDVFKKLQVGLSRIKLRCAKQYSTLVGGDYEI